jgi:tRNA A37 methylthiotransferase MiaB
MKSFYICSADCITKSIDSQRIYDYLLANGYTFTKNYSKADLIIITTCAFYDLEEEESIRAIKFYMKHKSKSSKIVITGCLPGINPNHLKRLGYFNVVNPTNLEKFDKIINPIIKFNSIPIPNKIGKDIQTLPRYYKLELINLKRLLIQFFKEFEISNEYFKRIIKRFLIERNRLLYKADKKFYLVIENGCLGNCTYCGIKFAIGRLKSQPIKALLREFKKGLLSGNQIFYISGEDTGAYGLDIGTNFVELLKEILKINGRYKIRIMDFNAKWLIKYYDDLEKLFVENPNKIEFIALGVQSGSNKVLKLMKRGFNINKLRKCLKQLLKKIPLIHINLHIIVGFPGETETDFKKTKDFIKEFGFYDITFTGYSDRPNTIASKMENKIDKKTINRRINNLIDLRYEIIKKKRKRGQLTCFKF